MDAKMLFRQGVTAIREEKDLAKGRDLITQSLRLDPDNDVAWVWLSRTVSDKKKQQQCLERALQINPDNQQVKAMMERLNGASAAVTTAPVAAALPTTKTPLPTQTSALKAPVPNSSQTAQ